MKMLVSKLKESLFSILPITVLVIVLSFTLVGIDGGTIGLFAVGAVFLIIGMSFFTLGADVAMMPMGSSVGSFLSKTKKNKLPLVLIVSALIGVFITIAEPDLQVLAAQLGGDDGPNQFLLWAVAIGVGIFLLVSVIRTFFGVKLKYLLLVCYAIVFILACFVPSDFLAVAFDSGGVTTGPITVPFLMAFGIGLAAVRGGENNSENSFGIIALCSVGPIIAVMILGISGLGTVSAPASHIPEINNFADILKEFAHGLGTYAADVGIALLPVIAIFFLFQTFFLKLPKSQIIRIIVGILYTYVGLVIFLTGVEIGFLPMGKDMGGAFALTKYKYALIPIGMLMGCFIVLAEPAVHVLNKQVEEITGGAISKKTMMIALCGGVAVAIGMAFLRVLTGVSIWYFIVPVYVVALAMMFIVPSIFTGIAFDSGGVASGPMTATFMLPFAIGASTALGGNVFEDAFGLVAFVAMIPLFTVQLMGLIYKLKSQRAKLKLDKIAAEHVNDGIIEFEDDEVIIFEDDEIVEVEKNNFAFDEVVVFELD